MHRRRFGSPFAYRPSILSARAGVALEKMHGARSASKISPTDVELEDPGHLRPFASYHVIDHGDGCVVAERNPQPGATIALVHLSPVQTTRQPAYDMSALESPEGIRDLHTE